MSTSNGLLFVIKSGVKAIIAVNTCRYFSSRFDPRWPANTRLLRRLGVLGPPSQDDPMVKRIGY